MIWKDHDLVLFWGSCLDHRKPVSWSDQKNYLKSRQFYLINKDYFSFFRSERGRFRSNTNLVMSVLFDLVNPNLFIWQAESDAPRIEIKLKNKAVIAWYKKSLIIIIFSDMWTNWFWEQKEDSYLVIFFIKIFGVTSDRRSRTKSDKHYQKFKYVLSFI